MQYTTQQHKYIDSVDGQAHASALEIIGELEAIPEGWRVHSLRLEAVQAERDRYRETIRSFLSTVLTINRENQQEWMEYLAERINEVCEVIGEEDRFAYNHRRESILPINKA